MFCKERKYTPLLALANFSVYFIIMTTIYAQPVQAKKVDPLANYIKKHVITKHTKPSDLSSSTKSKSGVVKTAKSYLGTRYRFGGTTRKSIDCSGFTQAVMKKHGKKLPRTARSQASVGKHVAKKNLRAGDLVFFKGTARHAKISHVGIMISKNKFIHASSGAKKVTITSINKAYYRRHYHSGRRV